MAAMIPARATDAPVALETEFNWEQSRTVSPTAQEDTRRGFYYVGYRWNF